MKIATLLWRNLAYFRRTHVAVILASAVGTAVLVGSLVLGDSVKASLHRLTQERLGSVEFALASQDGYFRALLAEKVSRLTGVVCVPVLLTRGTASRGGASSRQVPVRIVGVPSAFWGLAPVPAEPPKEGEAAVNVRAERDLGPGTGLVLRWARPSFLGGEAPLGEGGADIEMAHLRVSGIVRPQSLGDFGLSPHQVPPRNIFVPLDWLGGRTGRPGMANVLLATGRSQNGPITLDTALALSWRLADMGLRMRERGGGAEDELVSERIFLTLREEEAALATGFGSRGILTYFVNELRVGERSTPYSFVSAPGDDLLPQGMRDGEILINEWLARDLEAGPGTEVELSYFLPGRLGRLREGSVRLRVRGVVPNDWGDPDLTPPFPGLEGEKSCAEWDPAIPLDLTRVREKDEAYWHRYKGTPKAYLTLSQARRLWTSRYGALTAVRFQPDGVSTEKRARDLALRLGPSSRGLVFEDVRGEGVRAGQDSVDFGGLFLGLSFFLMASALVLVSLVFLLGADQRREEFRLLLALGFRARRVRLLLAAEGAILVVAGVLPGVAAGVGYTALVMRALATVWQGAVGTAALSLDVRPATVALGAGVSAIVGAGALWVGLWRHTLSGNGLGAGVSAKRTWPRMAVPLFALACFGGGAFLIATSHGPGSEAAGRFFGAGTLFLLGGMAGLAALLAFLDRPRTVPSNLWVLALRNAALRKGRSLSAAAVLALGVFLVTAVGANRADLPARAGDRSSGTGGFALYCETALPVTSDLDTEEGQRRLGLSSKTLAKTRVVSLRVQEGHDASCLNLNRTSRPRLLGVDPRAFGSRGAFSFAAFETPDRDPWSALEQELGPDEIPGVANLTDIVWNLGLEVGDTLAYRDEQGRSFRVRLVAGLANSVFQGMVVVSDKAFLKRFPSVSGARVFLLDVPPAQQQKVAAELEDGLGDLGVEVSSTEDRLGLFARVENTYLAIFLVLGALGLLLGTTGLAVVVGRNVLERRGELALLRAIGFTKTRIKAMLLLEHGLALGAGVILGATAGAIAVLPAMTTRSAAVPWAMLGITYAALLISGLAWTAIAATRATAGDLLPALRQE